MRYLAILILLAASVTGGVLVYRHLTAGLPVVLPAPRQLQVTAANGSLQPDGWTNSSTLYLRVMQTHGTIAGLDVEIRKQQVKFAGTPTKSTGDPSTVAQSCRGNLSCVAQVPTVRVRLADGSYHWQVRLHNRSGISPWVHYHGIIHVDTQPPAIAQLTSPTDPDPSKTYHSSTLQFAWQGNDTGSGVAGYSYRLDTDAAGVPRSEIRTAATSVTLQGLNTGTYYFHIRALDHAGNWGSSTTIPVHLDVTPPGLAGVHFNLFQLDPQFDPLHVAFAVTRSATSVHIGIYRQSDNWRARLYRLSHLAKGQKADIAWNGRDDRGQLVPSGTYEVYIRATDRYGHSSLSGWRDFVVDYRRILVSLSQQKLWAYDGSRVTLTSLVTTGNRALPTPTGLYHILGKFHPFTFHSPWPKSSPFYYSPSKTEWAMLFREGGYFIHDAPWRSAFGPGTNQQLGTPGSNYTGTHGCINVPNDVAYKLFGWAQIGTVVQVVQ